MTNPATRAIRGRWVPIAVLCLALLAIASTTGTAEAKKNGGSETLCYDVVVAGGGASGATLAGKLARAGVSVLLLEAGQNTQYEPSVALMQGFFGTYNARSNNIGLSSDSTYMWPNYIVGDSGRYGVKTPPGSGKGLGGGSTVFMANFQTGGKLMWSAFGPEWDWDEHMSAVYAEVFADIQPYRNPVKPVIAQLHLKAMRRIADEQYALGELDYMVNPANLAAGPNVENPDPAAPALNHNDLAGVNSVAAFAQFDFFSNKLADGTFIRKAPANTYLGPDCLHLNGTGVAPACPKLRVLTGAYVTRVLFDTDRVTGRPVAKGVEFVHEGAVKVASANVEVVVSAGSFQSPAVLQRSGLGDPAYLAQLGIPAVANITQVGRNLMNHFSLLMAVRVTGDACAISDVLSDALVTGGNMGFNGGAMLTYSKYDPNRPDNTTAHRKTQFMITTFGGILPKYISVPYNVGPANQSFTLAIDDIRFAARGYVQIPSSDPFAFPKVFFNTFVDYSNAALRGDAFWAAAKKGVEPTISGLLNYRIGYQWVVAANAVLAGEGNPARLQVAFPTASDLAFLDEAVEFYGLDWWKYLFPDRIITANSTPHEVAFVGVLSRLLNELRDKGAYVDSHQCGTNSIGAVVDGRLRVNGVDNLRVVDASIMPLQSGGNTGAAAVAIGIRGAQFVLEDITAAASAGQ